MKRLGIPLLLMIIISSFFFMIDTSADKTSEKKEVAKKIQKIELTRQEEYEGIWVSNELKKGTYTLKLTFEDETKAKVEYTYNDYRYITPAAFETMVEFNQYGEALFTFADDRWGHEGRGDLFLEDGKVVMYIKTNKDKEGGPFGVKEKISVFKRANSKKVCNEFKNAVQTKVKTERKGYLPKDELTYVYKSADGKANDEETFTKLKNGKMSSNPFSLFGTYELNDKGLFFTDQYKTKKKLLQFPVEKGVQWKSSENTTRMYLDTNYTLKGLNNVIVVKEERKTGEHEVVTYNYYHKDFGRVATGIDKKGKPSIEWVLVDVKK